MRRFAVIGLCLFFGMLIVGMDCQGGAGQGFLGQACAVTATDGLGRTIRLAKPPERIACLYAFSTHVAVMLGRGNRMVAVVRGVKKDKLLQQVLPGVETLPVPSAGGSIHIESLMETRPDIVFLKPETARIPSEIKKLERFGLPYFVVGYTSMAQQMETIEMMGKVLGCREKAADYTRFYGRTVAKVRSRTQDIPESEKVRLYHAINEPLRTDAPGTLEADWTQACGVINVSVSSPLESRSNKAFAGMEQILVWDPEVILANEAGVDLFIRSDHKWAPVRAVREHRVFLIPVGISRWGHPGGLETPLAVMWAAQKIYPERFHDLDMASEVRQFYQKFFGLDLDDKIVERILSGRGMRKKH